MSTPDRFPDGLRSSAVPRWSHRDPVQGGNPFAKDDARHQTWQTATADARDALRAIDGRLDAAFRRGGPQVTPYPDQVVDLVVRRFDIWARRGLSVVESQAALEEYREWLERYLEHWLVYVEDTCPRVERGDGLRSRLTARVHHWLEEAAATVGR